MTTFETQIFNCEKCKERLYYYDLSSYFITDSESYSDGYINSNPTLPSFNQIVICPNCQHVKWKDDIKTEEGYDTEDCIQCVDIGDIKRTFETNPNLELAKYYLYLINTGFTNSPDREITIRIEIWRTLNNSIRYSATKNTQGRESRLIKVTSLLKHGKNAQKLSKEEERIFIPNLEKLITLFKPEYYEQELLLAEMYRELRKFDNAMIVMENISQSGRDSIYDQIWAAVRNKNEKVFKLN